MYGKTVYDRQMQHLRAFENMWSKFGDPDNCWLGDISDARIGKLPQEIARLAGFQPRDDFLPPNVSAAVAARALSYGMRESLAYGKRRYRESESRDLKRMFQELGANAKFWASESFEDFGRNEATSSVHSGAKLTSATFEIGVIAANVQTGFIWWRTEED